MRVHRPFSIVADGAHGREAAQRNQQRVRNIKHTALPPAGRGFPGHNDAVRADDMPFHQYGLAVCGRRHAGSPRFAFAFPQVPLDRAIVKNLQTGGISNRAAAYRTPAAIHFERDLSHRAAPVRPARFGFVVDPAVLLSKCRHRRFGIWSFGMRSFAIDEIPRSNEPIGRFSSHDVEVCHTRGARAMASASTRLRPPSPSNGFHFSRGINSLSLDSRSHSPPQTSTPKYTGNRVFVKRGFPSRRLVATAPPR